MSFVTIKGLNGKVYVPDDTSGNNKKNRCKDCYSCNMCSDDRCIVCLGNGKHCRSDKCKDTH